MKPRRVELKARMQRHVLEWKPADPAQQLLMADVNPNAGVHNHLRTPAALGAISLSLIAHNPSCHSEAAWASGRSIEGVARQEDRMVQLSRRTAETRKICKGRHYLERLRQVSVPWSLAHWRTSVGQSYRRAPLHHVHFSFIRRVFHVSRRTIGGDDFRKHMIDEAMNGLSQANIDWSWTQDCYVAGIGNRMTEGMDLRLLYLLHIRRLEVTQ